MNQQLDRRSSRTLYEQLTSELRESLLSGVSVGEKIPTEDELVERYKTSRSTVRRAIKDLVDEGLLIRRQGKGTFLSRRLPKIVHEMDSLRPFYHTFKEHGEEPSTRILEMAWLRHNEVPASLRAQYDSSLFFRQVYMSAMSAHVVADVHVVPWIGESVSKQMLENRPIFEMYPEFVADSQLRSTFTISCGTTPSDIMSIMDLSSGAVTLLVERETVTDDGRIVDYAKLYLRSDVYSLRTTLVS